MKNILFILLAFCAAGFVSCEAEHDHEEDAIDMTALKATLQSMEDAYAKAQNARDAEGIVVYYADDAQSMGPEEPTLVGKAAILAKTKEEMAADTTAGGSTRFEVVDVFASGNLAVEVGRSISTNADGKESTGKYMSVFEKRDGKWICIRDIYNTDAPDDEDEGDDGDE